MRYSAGLSFIQRSSASVNG